jgi:hypothetical protein
LQPSRSRARAAPATYAEVTGESQNRPLFPKPGHYPLGLGILDKDVKALMVALADLKAAEATASATGPAPSAKQRQAAEARMCEAVERIAGAGVLAFAQDAKARAEFAALRAE